MTVLQAIILGIVQGIGEFLPISSSGHLLLLQRFFGIEDNLLTFSIVVHLGTLIPVLVIYFNRIKGLVFKPFQKLTYLLIIGTLPAIVVSLFFGDFLDRVFSGNYLAVGFLITALVLFVVDNKVAGRKKIEEVSYLDALIIGCVQAVAITPGISRSGSTIFGGITRGLNRKAAAEFSFLMSIPAIAGAAVLESIHIFRGSEESFKMVLSLPFIAGFLVSMGVGYVSIRLMLKLVVNNKLKYFSIYLVLLSAIILADRFFMGGMF